MDAHGRQNQANFHNQISWHRKTQGITHGNAGIWANFSIPEESHPKDAKVCEYPSSQGHCHPTAAAPGLSPTEKQQQFLQLPTLPRFHTRPWAKHIAFGAQAAPNWDRRAPQLLSSHSAKPCDRKRISAYARKVPVEPPGRMGTQALHRQLQQATPAMPLWGNFFSVWNVIWK